MSVRIKVIEGTPLHGKSLCFSCREAQVIQGHQASDTAVYCHAFFENPKKIEKPVSACSQYAKMTDQTLKQMEEIAWVIAYKKGKPIGFMSAMEIKAKQRAGEIDDD